MLHSGSNANGTEEDTPKGVQVVRLASRNKTVQVATHFDEGAKKDIVLWDDILVVFRDAAYIQVGPRVVPFLKGSNFQNLVPWRIAAIPGAVLDVVVKEEGAETTSTTGAGAGTLSGSPPGSSSSNGSNRTPSQQQQKSVAPQQRDPDAEPVRVIVTPPIPQRPVQSTTATLAPPTTSTATAVPAVGGQANTTRSPEYGLPEVAMAAFGHFDLPPDFLASLTSGGAARGTFTAAAEAVAAGRAPQFVSGNGNHPQGGGRPGAEDEDEGDGLAEGVVGLSLGGGSSPIQQQPRQQSLIQTQTQPCGAPQVQSSPSSGDPTTFTTTTSSISPKPSTAIDTAHLDFIISKARAGDTRQQLALGHMYRERRDFPKAMECFLEAAAAGDAQAQYNVGFMYNYGEGVPRSFRVALEWYEKAAVQGDGLAGYKVNKLRRDGFV